MQIKISTVHCESEMDDIIKITAFNSTLPHMCMNPSLVIL